MRAVKLTKWEIKFLIEMTDYELHNTDGHTDSEYSNMEALIKKLEEVKE